MPKLDLPRRKGLQVRPTIFENLNLRHLATPRHARATLYFHAQGWPAGPVRLKGNGGRAGTRTPDLLRVKKPCILLGFHGFLVFA